MMKFLVSTPFLMFLGMSPCSGELVASYDFAEGSLADGSGNGRDAMVVGGDMTGATNDPTFGDVFDLTGGGGFEGNPGTYLEIPSLDRVDGGSWAMAMWINDGSERRSYLFDNRDFVGSDGGDERLIFSTEHNVPGGIPGLFANGAWAIGPQTIRDEAWHHVAWVFDEDTGNLTVYVDGTPADTSTGVADLLAASIRLGNRSGDGAPGAQERFIAAVHVYDHAPTTEEIGALMTATGPSPQIPLPFEITSITRNSVDNTVNLTWNSQNEGPEFDVLSTGDLSLPLSEWRIEQIEISNDGDTTSILLPGIPEGRRFFVVRETPVPAN